MALFKFKAMRLSCLPLVGRAAGVGAAELASGALPLHRYRMQGFLKMALL
jgi:hypothetical protein